MKKFLKIFAILLIIAAIIFIGWALFIGFTAGFGTAVVGGVAASAVLKLALVALAIGCLGVFLTNGNHLERAGKSISKGIKSAINKIKQANNSRRKHTRDITNGIKWVIIGGAALFVGLLVMKGNK